MHESKLQKALLVAAEVVGSSDQTDANAMFDALVTSNGFNEVLSKTT